VPPIKSGVRALTAHSLLQVIDGLTINFEPVPESIQKGDVVVVTVFSLLL
jgi:hypothetical protein